MTYLVVGGGGFLGSYFIRELKKRGHTVVATAQNIEGGNADLDAVRRHQWGRSGQSASKNGDHGPLPCPLFGGVSSPGRGAEKPKNGLGY